jgi:hypothetical protein
LDADIVNAFKDLARSLINTIGIMQLTVTEAQKFRTLGFTVISNLDNDVDETLINAVRAFPARPQNKRQIVVFNS